MSTKDFSMKPIRSSVDNILRKSNTRELALTGLFVSLTAVGSQISIPLGPVPWTLQVFFVCLTGVFLPAKEAFFAQSLYLLLGLLGFPVFSRFGSGIPFLFGPTGGFLLTFPLMAFIIAKARSLAAFAATCCLSLALLYLFGALWLSFYLGSIEKALLVGVLPFLGWDLLKVFFIIRIVKRTGRFRTENTEPVYAPINVRDLKDR